MGRYSCLRTYYDVEKTIGSGGFGKVKLATHILTGEKVAIKIIDKKYVGSDYPRIILEFEALKSISHHNICQLYQFIETETHFFMVMEYCSGGELFDYIVQKSRLSESEARTFFRQIVAAVGYLHDSGFAHRDIKPENILLDDSMNLKLIDFGLCARPSVGMASLLKTSCGSPHYAAPELIQGQLYYGAEIDVWSLGVLLYTVLCGVLPFDDENIEGLYRKIIHEPYDEPNHLSTESKALIASMLKKNPRNRITIENIKKHQWMTINSTMAPVTSDSKIQHQKKELQCIKTMSSHYCVSEDDMWDRLKLWKYDYDTATYLILLARFNQGLPGTLKLSSFQQFEVEQPASKKITTPSQSEREKENSNYANVASCTRKSLPSRVPVNIHRDGWMTPTLTKRKRNNNNDDSPVPCKRAPGSNTKPALPKSTNKKSTTPANKIMQSIEKKINQVRDVVTPKRNRRNICLPAIISMKSTCNVSTTVNKDPCRVLQILKNSLDSLGIVYKVKKGFRLHGEIAGKPKGGRGCSFELEVCLIKGPTEEVVAIRRKRLNGDSWAYKVICEQILSITQSK